MEDVDERYENGVIYMIKHKTDDTKEYYIGSTKDFKTRRRAHKKVCNNQNSKQSNCKVYKYIRENGSWDEWELLLIYDYPCKNRDELKLEEQRAIKEYKSTLNKELPGRTQKEYNKDNKEKIKQKSKIYNEANKEKIAQKKKEHYEANKEKILQQNKGYRQNNKDKLLERLSIKINCDICNSLVRKGDIAKHKRTQKCKNSHK
jgi:hypothetical protein